MGHVTRLPETRRRQQEGLAEVETLAWLLDNSIPIPGTGGRRIGLDAIIGFVPVVGDLSSAGIGLFVVWRAARLGLPRVVVARMLANSALDLTVGAIPVLGDGFDMWFKANSRNLRLLRRYLESPETSTRGESLWLLALGVTLLVAVGVVLWLIVSFLSIEIG